MSNIKINEKWKCEKIISSNNEISHFQLGYRNGAFDMTKAVYQKALEIYNDKLSKNPDGFESLLWDNARLVAFDMLTNGNIEPPE